MSGVVEQELTTETYISSEHAHLLIEWVVRDDEDNLDGMNDQVRGIPLIDAALGQGFLLVELKQDLELCLFRWSERVAKTYIRLIKNDYEQLLSVNIEELLRYVASNASHATWHLVDEIKAHFGISQLFHATVIDERFICKYWTDPLTSLDFSETDNYILKYEFLLLFFEQSRLPSIFQEHPILLEHIKGYITYAIERSGVPFPRYSLEDAVIIGVRILTPLLEVTDISRLDWRSLSRELLEELEYSIPTLHLVQ
jgi:hypothetical protein